MDYGAMLKKQVVNPNRRSLHYQRQAPFEGSQRQLRGFILREILEAPGLTESAIIKKCKKERHEVQDVLEQFRQEGFIRKIKNRYVIA
jgi:A/G-specific adenine glycosylase